MTLEKFFEQEDSNNKSSRFIEEYLNDPWMKLMTLSRTKIRDTALKLKKPKPESPGIEIEKINARVLAIHFHPTQEGYITPETERLQKIIESEEFKRKFPGTSPKLRTQAVDGKFEGIKSSKAIVVEL